MARIARANKEFPDELPKQHEIVRGMLVRKAMPFFAHGELQAALVTMLRPINARWGGGWWLGTECEIELYPDERYLPDVAAWHRAQVPELPTDARIRVAPQWVCEILSPSTAKRDRGHKQATYHAANVNHYWLLDPRAKTLTVLEWAEDQYRVLLTAGADERVRAAPFEAVELDLGELLR